MRPLFLTLLSGLLLALSLPPYNVDWLGWVAVAPLLVAAVGRRPLEAVGVGMLAGIVCGLFHLGWRPDQQGMQFAWLPFLWLAILLGMVATGAAGTRRRWQGARWALFVTGLGVTVEWITTFSPLPLNLALCQHRTLPVIQIASVTGIWGVSLLLWWVNAALADLGVRANRGPQSSATTDLPECGLQAAGLRAPTCGMNSALRQEAIAGSGASGRLQGRSILQLCLTQGAPLLALALTLAYGHWALAVAERHAGPSVRVAAIQDHSAAETAHLLSAAATEAPEVDRDELTRQAAARGAELIVWSENCLGAAFAPDAPVNPTADLARALRVHLVVGYSDAARPRPFNCAAIVAPDGSVKGVHRKIHPFLGETRAIQRGRTATAFPTDLGRIGVEICFDSCYTGVTRRVAAAGAQLIAMPNYDPPTPGGILHRLHGAVLPFRAVENRVPFVRADPNGLSQIVDATGRIRAQSPLFAADTLVGDVPLSEGRGTPFTRWGDWLAYLCLLGVMAACMGASRSRRLAAKLAETLGQPARL
jgi:apolipoprotein N-acyltransferase